MRVPDTFLGALLACGTSLNYLTKHIHLVLEFREWESVSLCAGIPSVGQVFAEQSVCVKGQASQFLFWSVQPGDWKQVSQW